MSLFRSSSRVNGHRLASIQSDWNTAELHDTATNSGRLKAPVAGKYYIFANITWETPIGSGLWGLRLHLNGKAVIAEQSLPNTAAPFREFQCRLGPFMRSPPEIMSRYRYFRTAAIHC